MKNVIILLGMLTCLFGPSAVFSYIGYKSMKELSARPSDSVRVMPILVVKLAVVAAVLMGVLVILLKVFA